MIKPEQLYSITHEISMKARVPIDMTARATCGKAIPPDGGVEVDVIRVSVTVTDENGETLAIGHIVENRSTLDPESFSLWLLGYIQGVIGTLDAAEADAFRELAALAGDGSMRKDH